MSAKHNAPVIIKRKKIVQAGGHHGGAWKVAYADFVTALMAFFLLMWLLNATTEKQRKGIADYFNPTIPINRVSGGGDGVFGGESVFSEDNLAENAEAGAEPPGDAPPTGQSGAGTGAAGDEARAFGAIERALSAQSGESMAADRTLRHIVTRVTDEGLIIELFDLEGDPLFEADGITPTPLLVDLADVLARVFDLVGNPVAVNGHVRSYPVVLARDPVWPLSWERAGALRALIVEAGLDDRRFTRVAGFADRDPVAVNPASVRNNRLEVILLRAELS
ncbi:flagellar motor protein MotB [Frigidibacter sp. ROC022]|uniref:flagellar motor protein MotB n=1 Tax=Frigidibacter sp. ROC022 TaxID=2971796 RepID=UPI00215A2CD8|nr:flagellar motor protein MotB [Frigidibacter sp. ROC022]MCR8724345.1 chemotaxis protein MotB [Frigidibacter sp. ROC022]